MSVPDAETMDGTSLRRPDGSNCQIVGKSAEQMERKRVVTEEWTPDPSAGRNVWAVDPVGPRTQDGGSVRLCICA